MPNYTIQPGDNPAMLAEKLFGDQRWAIEIMRMNPGMTNWIAGTVISIPEVDKVKELQDSGFKPFISNETFNEMLTKGYAGAGVDISKYWIPGTSQTMPGGSSSSKFLPVTGPVTPTRVQDELEPGLIPGGGVGRNVSGPAGSFAGSTLPGMTQQQQMKQQTLARGAMSPAQRLALEYPAAQNPHHATDHPKEWPQPQVDVAFGFLMANPPPMRSSL